jgi:hypothetical protein
MSVLETLPGIDNSEAHKMYSVIMRDAEETGRFAKTIENNIVRVSWEHEGVLMHLYSARISGMVDLYQITFMRPAENDTYQVPGNFNETPIWAMHGTMEEE